MKKITGLSTLVLLVCCIGCGPTNRHVLKGYEGPFNEKRQQFKKIAGLLPATGSAQGSAPANLSPKPLYNAKSDQYNTEILMYDQLQDPDIESQDHNRLDLLLSGNLLRGIQWTGPKNPMADEILDRRATADLEQSLKQALGIRYLIVLRPATFVKPVAVNESNYKPGMADIEGFIVDMEGNKIVGTVRFTANSSDRVEYSYKEGQDRQRQLEEF